MLWPNAVRMKQTRDFSYDVCTLYFAPEENKFKYSWPTACHSPRRNESRSQKFYRENTDAACAFLWTVLKYAEVTNFFTTWLHTVIFARNMRLTDWEKMSGMVPLVLGTWTNKWPTGRPQELCYQAPLATVVNFPDPKEPCEWLPKSQV